MARVLLLIHRLPYPPNKGDKVRSYRVLRFLADRHDVYLGTFVDDEDDRAHVPTVASWCRGIKVVRLRPALARLKSLTGLARGEALSLSYYRSPAMQAWVNDLIARKQVDAAVVFSSAMTPYVDGSTLPRVVDFVDMDSAKWREYANKHRWPLSWLYRREGERLFAHERAVARATPHCFFVTDKETAMFRDAAPECADHVFTVGNGVDVGYFSPQPERVSPFDANEIPLVFTGAMDYWPNEDAVAWFVSDVLPALRRQHPRLVLSIVGRNPSAAVRALASESVRVTGTVDDVRGWLQHAAVVVAPLRLARGVQNKVLEAMAMARPVVAAAACVQAIDATEGVHVAAAETPDDYVREVNRLLTSRDVASTMGRAGRECVQQRYDWQARLMPFAHRLESL